MPLLTHDKKTAENTALAVIADAGSDYPFDSGLYLFPDEPNLDYDIVEDYKNKSRKIIKPGNKYAQFFQCLFNIRSCMQKIESK